MPTPPARRLAPAVAGGLVVLLTLLSGCAAGAQDEPDASSPPSATRVPEAGTVPVDAVEVPQVGACRLLTPEDVAAPADATETVACEADHTAETYATGQLPAGFDDAAYDDPALGSFAYRTCSTGLRRFLGADESLAMRTVVSWAWFRPSEKAWSDGARWYRCDAIGGGAQSGSYTVLPTTARGLLLGRPDDRWLVCAAGDTVTGGEKVACSQEHDWRAVSTIVLGTPDDDYPGDRVAEVTTRDYCSESVSALLSYPVDYEYAYTFFHEAEWEAGNRRSICWARTPD